MTRKNSAVTRLACGCSHDDSHWLLMCHDHAAEAKEVHDRWARERLSVVLASEVVSSGDGTARESEPTSGTAGAG
jgi:hypothetical protein